MLSTKVHGVDATFAGTAQLDRGHVCSERAKLAELIIPGLKIRNDRSRDDLSEAPDE